MGNAEIALLISAIVALFGILTFAFARSGDHGKREYWEGQTTNKLDGIIDDLKDMKALQRLTDQRINEVQIEAHEAKQRADSAHERLDRAGIA
mgnify:CR=1 FL=1